MSSRRWGYLIRLGLVALVVAAGLSVGVRPAGREAWAQDQDETVAVRDLAERLLAPSLLGPGAEPISARLLPGEVPAGLPVEFPMPDGSRLIGSLVRLTGNETSGATVVIEASGTAASILAFYEQALTAQGWTTAPFAGPGNPPGGLQPTLLPVSRAYCLSTRGPQMSVTVLPRAAGPSDVRLTLDTLFPYACQSLQQPSEADLLPPLYTPPGVELLPSNPPRPITGGKPALSSSDGIAETEMAVDALEAHIAEQLTSATWQRIDGGLTGPVAWSTWTLPGPGDWRGLLLVTEGPGPGQRLIHVQVVTASAPPR